MTFLLVKVWYALVCEHAHSCVTLRFECQNYPVMYGICCTRKLLRPKAAHQFTHTQWLQKTSDRLTGRPPILHRRGTPVIMNSGVHRHRGTPVVMNSGVQIIMDVQRARCVSKILRKHYQDGWLDHASRLPRIIAANPVIHYAHCSPPRHTTPCVI